MAVSFTWADLVTILGSEGQDFLSILTPFVPSLIAASEQVYVGFIQNLSQGNLDANIQLMYPLMSVQDRETLETQVYKDLVTATQAKADRAALFKEIALKFAIDIMLKIATGGIA